MRPVRDPAILLAAILLAVTACGGGAATTGQSQATATASAPETTGEAAETAAAEGPTEAPATGGTFDACTLLTTDEVKSITGAATTSGPEGSDMADWVAGTCWWNSADMKVRFSLDYGDKASIAKSSSPSAQEQFDITKAVYGAMAKVEDLSGVGDKAFAWDGGAYAIKGDKAILVTVMFSSKTEVIAILKAAVAKI